MERTLTYYGDSSTNIPYELKKVFETFNIKKTYQKGEMIYIQGEQAESFYYLKSGQVKIFLSSKDGFDKTLSIIGGGGILGQAAFFDELPRISSAKAIYESDIIVINREKFMEKIKEKPDLAMSLLRLQAKSVRMLSSQVTSITFFQADCRIARTLINAKLKDSKSNQYYVYLTHEEIGDIVGVSRVTVSNILNKFKREQVIDTRYRNIIIRDIKELERVANFEME